MVRGARWPARVQRAGPCAGTGCRGRSGWGLGYGREARTAAGRAFFVLAESPLGSFQPGLPWCLECGLLSVLPPSPLSLRLQEAPRLRRPPAAWKPPGSARPPAAWLLASVGSSLLGLRRTLGVCIFLPSLWGAAAFQGQPPVHRLEWAGPPFCQEGVGQDSRVGDLFGLRGVPITAPLACTAFSSLEAHVGAIWGTCGWGDSAGPPMTPSFAQEPKGQGVWSPAPADVLLGSGLQAPSLQDTHWHPPLGFSRPRPPSAPIPPGRSQESHNPTGLRRVLAAARAPSPRSVCLSVWNASVFLSPRVVRGECACVCVRLCFVPKSLPVSLSVHLVCLCRPMLARPVVIGPLFGETEPLSVQNFGP